MITLRSSEAVSPSGQRYMITTQAHIWEGREFDTKVFPIAEEPVEYVPYSRKYETQGDALKGHKQAVQDATKGDLDGLLNVRRKN